MGKAVLSALWLYVCNYIFKHIPFDPEPPLKIRTHVHTYKYIDCMNSSTNAGAHVCKGVAFSETAIYN